MTKTTGKRERGEAVRWQLVVGSWADTPSHSGGDNRQQQAGRQTGLGYGKYVSGVL